MPPVPNRNTTPIRQPASRAGNNSRTASACVRATAEDVIADGFRPIVVRECIGDRIAGAVEWNLFDIDAKFADVEPLDAVLAHLQRNEA